MNPDWLVYFTNLIEGRPAKPWHVWWRDHEPEIEPALGRMSYLKLKFEKLEYAASLLSKAGIPYTWSAHGRRAVIYGRLDPSCLDDITGRPRPEFRERDGDYIQAFAEGNHALGHKRIRKHISRIKRIKDEIERCEALGDLEYEAEGILDEGYTEAGVALLTAVAQWKPASCLEDAPIEYARERLKALT